MDWHGLNDQVDEVYRAHCGSDGVHGYLLNGVRPTQLAIEKRSLGSIKVVLANARQVKNIHICQSINKTNLKDYV